MARFLRHAGFPLWACAFALAYTQAPPYYSNQNQYLLHGLAAAGRGTLSDDWLANTASPTPVFDALVEATARHGHESFFHVYYVLLMALYLAALRGLFARAGGERATSRRMHAFTALVVLVHSAALRWASYHFLGADDACYLQGWFASQYVLGPVFQPSAFGVLLLWGIERFVNGRLIAAFVAVALAGVMHSTYLLPGGILTAAFAARLAREGRWQAAFLLPLLALAIVLPTILHALRTFAPTDPETFADAQRILAWERIPHHCDPRRFFDGIAFGQLMLMMLGIVAARGRACAVLAALYVASVLLTGVQLATGSPGLALLFPWRSSVILIPAAVAMLLARLVLWGGWANTRFVTLSAVILGAASALAGVAIMANHAGYPTDRGEEPLLAFVKATAQPGDVYLLPVQLPAASGPRGAMSSDFKPLPDLKGDARAIPPDLQRFRLVAAAPVYADFKAIPYRDADVLEWHRRVQWAKRFYAGEVAVEEVRAAGVTHVVTSVGHAPAALAGLPRAYADERYELVRIGK